MKQDLQISHKKITRDQGPVVEKVDSAILQLSLYPVVNAIGFPNDYSLDINLSSLQCRHFLRACECFARESAC